jgi:hypothetical protein
VFQWTIAAVIRLMPEAQALVLEGPVTDFSLAMEEHRAPKRVAGLAFIEASMATQA